MLTEQTAVPQAALPIQEFKDHLRLGSGFADDGVQDTLAVAYLRAALAAIEGRVGKALIARDFLLTLSDWRDGVAQAFPLAPVTAIGSVAVRDMAGVATVVAPSAYRLQKDLHRPKIMGVGASLPSIPSGGTVELVFTAGFGPTWANVPVDLGQAVLLLAAQFHEKRHEGGERTGTLPFGVLALIERWRTVRVLGGGEA